MFHGYGLPEGNGTIDDGLLGFHREHHGHMNGTWGFSDLGSQWEYNGNVMDMSM